MQKRLNIPGYRIDWRRVVTTHTRVGVNSLSWQSTERTDSSSAVHCNSFAKNPFLVKNFIMLDNPLCKFNSEWIDLDPDLHAGKNTNAHGTHDTSTRTDKHTHILFLIWPIKRCVFVNRKISRGADTHTHTPTRAHVHTRTHTQQVQCWGTLWCAQPKNNETRIESPCQTATVLREFIVSYFNNATLFHSNLFFKNSNLLSSYFLFLFCTN